ncbi:MULTISPECIES: DUF2835 domain-containing protein [Marinobacter]|jgi:hypothetical protein|uniref:DUF2835 domain-containing protein n=4 Tax=Marinobacter TaxID=2742 RepID=A0A137S7T1_9GAMM|nr:MULTISPECIES: DUF2835 domain-containing protein [Marinobacter]MDX5327399.1 DUF2835 domain-containing protein [Marinobacter sp.]MDX5440711.1 DUF2835 domain-containing protein [Alteromonadaceae bacterium]KXO08458.1 hypothetical protein J122_2828 [Marinobacter excellens LAMA 842]MCD1631203.1 DUF2835 domain-containing protein [Marinobacter shengliensis]OJT00201.1 hypothetical protein BEE62_08965 [Marinobacter nauticus]|tara:strand:- start:994 stop:1212 length:219 start_codon:yes stop_codon:yes gene_type:complete
MQQIIVDISISPDEWIKLYQGVATDVRTTARDGRSVRFPARILSRFFLKDGIQGSFRILFDDQGKFASIERL